MLSTAVIVFRETLEAALVVSIIMAATYGVTRRGVWVGSGVVIGFAGACIVAASAGAITAAAEGIGQELLNASILMVAVIMLGWHTIWMSQHGREISREMGEIGKAVATGDRPLYALAVAAGAAVLREGSETVLFLYGIASSGDDSATEMVAGGLLGGVTGIGVGLLLYRGLTSIPLVLPVRRDERDDPAVDGRIGGASGGLPRAGRCYSRSGWPWSGTPHPS